MILIKTVRSPSFHYMKKLIYPSSQTKRITQDTKKIPLTPTMIVYRDRELAYNWVWVAAGIEELLINCVFANGVVPTRLDVRFYRRDIRCWVDRS